MYTMGSCSAKNIREDIEFLSNGIKMLHDAMSTITKHHEDLNKTHQDLHTHVAMLHDKVDTVISTVANHTYPDSPIATASVGF